MVIFCLLRLQLVSVGEDLPTANDAAAVLRLLSLVKPAHKFVKIRFSLAVREMVVCLLSVVLPAVRTAFSFHHHWQHV